MLNKEMYLCKVLLFMSAIYLSKSDSIYYQDSMMKQIYLEEGSSQAELQCSCRSPISSGRIEWYNELGQNLLTDSSFLISDENNINSTMSSVMKFNVSLNKGGIYICNILSKDKNENKIYEVFINANRESISGPSKIQHVEVINVTTDSALIDVKISGNAKEIVSIYVEEIENIVISKKFSKGEKLLFTNLIPGGKYKFQFLTRPSGREPWSPILVVRLLPDAPEAIVRVSETSNFQIEWFRQRNDLDRRRGIIDKYLLSYSIIDTQYNESTYHRRDHKKVDPELKHRDCEVNIEIPSCYGDTHLPIHYTISNLNLAKDQLYEVRLKAHNSEGYGKLFKIMIRIPK